ncbi:SAM-dependent methyltransferase [Acinetobacter silvestris]|uniref:SAM-dependent methyltransferase n=1 Tax=Acinetobacter silvestris TaxID=1977882 RepID=A0A1Y3CAW0_9GAMM|nr:class I SAM-dependent methyltransferase [Acinetobacter silvestris]OTG64187.1 SAM-dependent methyltransferase [Acinetobacter silvestris]
MKWLQAFRKKLPTHKYAINAKLLGDSAECAWSNLGFWDAATVSYPQACQQLADQLAQAVALNSNDQLLDLGCGQGASLKYWLEHYHIQTLSAVELQFECVEHIQTYFSDSVSIYQQSFLNLNLMPFHGEFDVVLCIDAAYHSRLNSFLSSVSTVLNVKGRLGFHYLMWSEQAQNLNWMQQKKYQYLLKAADVNVLNLARQHKYVTTLMQHDFEQIEIIDISQHVLDGFSDYFQTIMNSGQNNQMDFLKIRMTAWLCKKLYQDGIVRYVQISAVKK